MIFIKRVYEPYKPSDGPRFLVDRLWPRGIRKEELHMDAWLKDLAPSNDLRQWFGHNPDNWVEFCKRYEIELEENGKTWRPLLEIARRQDITLIFSARDVTHNNAVVLRSFLITQLINS
jgi:uncharacterized protein YeaO (DUF488 family)